MTEQRHTEGPLARAANTIYEMKMEDGQFPYDEAEIADQLAPFFEVRDWHALLLRAVLNGWRIELTQVDRWHVSRRLQDSASGEWYDMGDFSVDGTASGLPACPDAETFERIRLAVEGE